jgi:hypothetical protein
MILGVDVGLTGGIAMLSSDGVCLEPMPRNEDGVDAQELGRIIQLEQIQYAYIEKPFAMAKSGAFSMLNFGRAVGVVHGLLASFAIPIIEVRPQEWQKFAYAGCPDGVVKKHRSTWAFKRLFPGVSATEPGKKTQHMGMVEAALIAAYGQKMRC